MSEPDKFQKPFPDRQDRYIPDWSQFKVYSIGIVAEDKPAEYDHEIKVVPLEIIPNYDGKVKHEEEEAEIEGFDRHKENYTVTITKSTTITAEWIQLFGTHRNTSPNVKRGERVLLWRYAEEDRFYWTPMGMDDHLRRLEHITWSFSAEPEESNELEYDKNLYYLTISTRDKYIKFRTAGPKEDSKHDEPYIYTFYWSTADGYFYFQDDDDRARGKPNPNRIYFDTEERVIYALNSDETQVRLDKEDIYFHCHNDLIGEVGNNATVDIGNNVTAYVGNNATAHIGNDLTANIGNDVTVSIGNNLKADITNMVEAKIGGNMFCSVMGNLDTEVGGNVILSSSSNVLLNANGSMNIKGNGVSISSGSGSSAAPQPPEPTPPEAPSFEGPWPSGSEIVEHPTGDYPYLRTKPASVDTTPMEAPPQGDELDARIGSARDLLVDITRHVDGTIGGDVNLTTQGDDTRAIGGNRTETVGGSQSTEVTSTFDLQTTGVLTLKSATSITLEAPTVNITTDNFLLTAAVSQITGGEHTVSSDIGDHPACHTSTGC